LVPGYTGRLLPVVSGPCAESVLTLVPRGMPIALAGTPETARWQCPVLDVGFAVQPFDVDRDLDPR
jgi:hypothetical protein